MSLLYNYRFSNDKSFFKCSLTNVRKAFKLCKNSIKCIEQNLNQQNIQEPEKANEIIKGGFCNLIDKLIKKELDKYKLVEMRANMLKDILNK